jgi:hypothetical protein
MAGTSLLALLDDITTILDDVAAMTKVATKKTAGVLGDDLALNAEQVTGVATERELPVVWAVAKGSAVNKLILVPAALAISGVAPMLIKPLLMIGGAFLCFEGTEKIAHKLLHPKEEASVAAAPEVVNEQDKIKGAVRTDFVLSAEIIVISLGTISSAPFAKQVAVLSTVAVVMTVGVYGLVAGIVKLDDLGLALSRKEGAVKSLGKGILVAAPYLMKFLSVAGTVAMFLVGGGILAHGLPGVHGLSETIEKMEGVAGMVLPSLFNGALGLAAGALILGVVTLIQKMRKGPAAALFFFLEGERQLAQRHVAVRIFIPFILENFDTEGAGGGEPPGRHQLEIMRGMGARDLALEGHLPPGVQQREPHRDHAEPPRVRRITVALEEHLPHRLGPPPGHLHPGRGAPGHRVVAGRKPRGRRVLIDQVGRGPARVLGACLHRELPRPLEEAPAARRRLPRGTDRGARRSGRGRRGDLHRVGPRRPRRGPGPRATHQRQRQRPPRPAHGLQASWAPRTGVLVFRTSAENRSSSSMEL